MTGDSQPWRPQQRNAYCNVHFSKNDITARNGIFIPPKIYTEDLIIIFNIYILTISFFIENYLISIETSLRYNKEEMGKYRVL